jgi:hypothetical protein
MKRKIMFGILITAAMLMIGMASAALYLPLPIDGKTPSAGLTIQVQNLRTGKILTTRTSGAGEFLVDWANSDDSGGTILKYQSGDRFQITITDCKENPSCSQTVTYGGQAEIFVTFDVLVEPVCPDCEICENTCPEQTWQNIGIGAVVGLIVAGVAFFGGGIKIYKSKLGQTVFQHQHKGISGYHDPNISHTNPKFKHRRWKDDPVGCMNDVKKINEDGGL